MISTKKEVQVLASLMLEKGIRDVVISPGSRNAPLINTFDALAEFTCYNVVDERSAAFFALGIALRKRCPVAIACTSGSAMLNYAPAVAEALYQHIPLLILSADRPRSWVDQGDGQTIRQENALSNIVTKSVSLTGGMRDEDEVWYNTRLINEALNALTFPELGPVHINLPFAEPLYDMEDVTLPKVKNISFKGRENRLFDDEMECLREQWMRCPKKMILVGQMSYDPEMECLLNNLANEHDIVVLTEKTSNIQGDKIVTSIDNVLTVMDDEMLVPDLLITLGGPIVSKKIKYYLRYNKPKVHWHFSCSADIQDTFMALTELILASPILTLRNLSFQFSVVSGYAAKFQELDILAATLNRAYAKQIDFCDFTVFDKVLESLPEAATLHLSNSTPVRYAQLFPMKKVIYQCNRGTSGIDGVISTAAGYALADHGFNVLVIGDLSFFYDSNALWNCHFPDNLKIVLINNGGGGIFRFIDGPSHVPASEQHFVAKHTTKAEGLVRNFGVAYASANELESFTNKYKDLLASDKAGVLEVFTPAEKNAEILRGYFDFLKNNR